MRSNTNERPLPPGTELTIVFYLTGIHPGEGLPLDIRTTVSGIKTYVDDIPPDMGAVHWAERLGKEIGIELRPMTQAEIDDYRVQEAKELAEQEALEKGFYDLEDTK